MASNKDSSNVSYGGRNYTLAVTATPVAISSNDTDIAFERSTVEIYNSGAKTIYVYFKGSAAADGRPILPETSISYAVSERAILFVLCSSGQTSTAVITELQ